MAARGGVADAQEPPAKAAKGLFGARRRRSANDTGDLGHVRRKGVDAEIAQCKSGAAGMDGELSVDVAAWWALRQDLLPLLSMLAPIYLVAPASTAAAGRAFSIAGRIARPVRASLTPKSIAVLTELNRR